MTHEVPHHFEQVGEWLLTIDEVLGGDIAPADNI